MMTKNELKEALITQLIREQTEIMKKINAGKKEINRIAKEQMLMKRKISVVGEQIKIIRKS